MDGQLQMATLPLDVDGVVASDPSPVSGHDGGMAAGTRIGHVHLQVASIPAAEEFYVGALGFEPTVSAYPGALFVSAGGYHHHLGLNTWAGRGAPPPPSGSRGLRSFTVVLPSEVALARTIAAAADAGIEAVDEDGQLVVTDPSGNRAVLTVG